MELVAPAEIESCLGEGIVPDLSAGMSFCEVCRVGCNLVGDDSDPHVFLVRKGQMLLRGHVAEHGGSQPGDLSASYG